MAQDKSTMPQLWGAAWASEIGPEATWRDALTQAADIIAHHFHLHERIRAGAQDSGFPEDIQTSCSVAAFEFGTVVGYCLAQTLPGRIQDFGDWPARALDLADLQNWRNCLELPPPQAWLQAVDSGEEAAQ